MVEYAKAGFDGCAVSQDGTNFLSERVPSGLKNQNTGHKSSHTARAVNLSVSHRRRVLHATRCLDGSWNDMTLQIFDKLMVDMREGEYDDITFELFEWDDVEITTIVYHGIWGVVDNGYTICSTAIPPLKVSGTLAEHRFSEWGESLRKDVECTIGILKRRYLL